jgi:hypothetical protein
MKLFAIFIAFFCIQLHTMNAEKAPISNINDTITWLILNDLEYKEAKHDEYGTVYLPQFSKKVKKYANKKVIIRGYLVPVDKNTWALSKNTYAACFFCGKAGPETVMGLTFKGDPGKLKMDANATVTGKFVLNGSDVDDWMYSLIDVEIISIK